jgi:SecD/SecF fusion protein
VITLLPIVSLLLFGGDTLKDFAFALLVGIGLGAVSTIFVATPFLTVIMERTPEYAARKGLDTPQEKLLEPEEGAPAEATPAQRLARKLPRRAAATAAVGAAVANAPPGETADEDAEAAAEPEPEADLEPAPEPSAEPAPEPQAGPGAAVPAPIPAPPADAEARREARRQRRRTKPHGRAR